MALTDENNMVMPVAPMYGGNGGGFGSSWGNDGSFWLLILFLFAFMGNGWGNGVNGGGTTYVANDIQRGFDQATVTGGINDIAANMCNGFSNVQQALCNGFNQAEVSNNARQMADMQQMFALQSQMSQCCCDNRAATADLKYTIATEACADRTAVSNALRDVIASNTANTQAILDKMCQQEIEALKTQNANLQTQLNMANLAASQGVQTSQIISELMPKAPIPAYVVKNPYCTCEQATGGTATA